MDLRTLVWVALGILLTLGALRLVLPRIVPFFVFHPEPLKPQESDPRYWGLPQGGEVTFRTEDGVRLHAWWFPRPAEAPPCGAAIYFHGNAGHLAYRGEIAAGIASLGFDVLLPDYRGYGLSGGRPSEEGLYRDARAAYRFLRGRSGEEAERVLLVGNSLGSAVAAELATREEVGGLVLVGAFENVRSVARDRWPWLPGWLLPVESPRFDTASRVERIRAPTLFAVATGDRVIPPDQGRRLYDAAAEPKRWYEVVGAGHNDVFGQQGLWLTMQRFVGEQMGCG